MTILDFLKMLEAIKDKKTVYIPYQLHKNRELHRVIDALNGADGAYEYFKKVIFAEKPTILKPIPDYGDHMTLDNFIEDVKAGCLIDYDGTGYYATDKEMTNLEAIPSEIKDGNVNDNYTHVVWFNK